MALGTSTDGNAKKEEAQPASNESKGGKDPGDSGSLMRKLAIIGLASAGLGGVLCLTGYGCSAKKDKDGDPDKGRAATSLVLPPPRTKQFLDSKEALAAVRANEFAPVEEFSSLSSDNSVLVFKSTQGEGLAILRGLPIGAERNELIRQLQDMGHAVPASLAPVAPSPGIGPNQSQAAAWLSLLSPLLYTGAIAGLGFIGLGLVGRSLSRALGAQDFITERPSARLSDYGGNRQIRAWGEKLVKDIQAVAQGASDRRLPRGILLEGEPGVGKSFLMQCVAGEAGCPLIIAAASELRSSPFAGSRVKGIENLFAAARAARDKALKEMRGKPGATGKEEAVVLVLVDEIDSIARSRTGGKDPLAAEDNDAINAFLANMDGPIAAKNHHIILLGATNFVDQIDAALRRPGRFSTKMRIDIPNTAGERLDVLEKLVPSVCQQRGCEVPAKESLEILAEALVSATPATLRAILEEAAQETPENSAISMESLLLAFQTVELGPIGASMERPERRLLVSAHEFGHALVGYAFGLMPVIISMRPRGVSLGRVLINSARLSEPPCTSTDIKKMLMTAAAGRGGELAFLGGTGEASDGVMSDFDSISKNARLFIDTGMLDGSYALSFREKSDGELPAERRRMVEAIGDAAVILGARILRSLPASRFDALASSALDKEFLGDAAIEYIESVIPEAERRELKVIAERALKDFPATVRQCLKETNDESSEVVGERLRLILKSEEPPFFGRPGSA